jgi:hypothetical protein
MMRLNPFDKDTGDEFDPQVAESDALASLGMHVAGEDDDDLEVVEVVVPVADEDEEGVAKPSDDLDKDGIAELEEMEKRLLEEDPVLDFAVAEDE